MRLDKMVVKGFQSFGHDPTTVTFDSRTFLIGPNGAGKTAVLQALTRLFGYPSQIRGVEPSDFHRAPADAGADSDPTMNDLWIEAHFTFPELVEDEGLFPAIPACFDHMTLADPDGIQELRVRLTAMLDDEMQVEERLVYVVEADEHGDPAKTSAVKRFDRNMIQVHYLPAKRDPGDHIRYTTTSLLGRLLRSASWAAERPQIETLTTNLGELLAGHAAVSKITTHLGSRWNAVHQGTFFVNPAITFGTNDIDSLMRHLTIRFGPAPGAAQADYNLLSDGQQSLLYISLVLAVQAIGREVLAGEATQFDADKLRPPVFVMIAVEEPENSLSPHHLGRLLSELNEFSTLNDAQVAFATHSPAILRRVPPEQIRFLRLDGQRHTTVQNIRMPDASDEAFKFVREAVLAYPELYFARLVVLGEGASEEVVLPRVLAARGLIPDHISVSVVPLGGRHVNHFWRLLHGLKIPHVTLLDLDAGRNHAGWSRLKYALDQHQTFAAEAAVPSEVRSLLKPWDSPDRPDLHDDGTEIIAWLEEHSIFYSAPLDLDFTMIGAYPDAYGVAATERSDPDESTVAAVLGKGRAPTVPYSQDEQTWFEPYRSRFIDGSKPAAHLEALAELSDSQLTAALPPAFSRLVQSVAKILDNLPE